MPDDLTLNGQVYYTKNGTVTVNEGETPAQTAPAQTTNSVFTTTPRKKPMTEHEAAVAYYTMRLDGQLDKSTSNEQIQEWARNYAKNDQRRDEYERTEVFLDKEKYKAAEQQRKQQRDARIAELRQQGYSRREARRMADAELPINNYLSKGFLGSSARRFIERNKDKFYENGEFSSAKFQEYMLQQAQRGNQRDGETTNYHYDLHESDATTAEHRAQGRRTTKHQTRMLGKAAGLDTQLSHKTVCTVVGAAAGAGIGALIPGSTVALTGAAAASNAAAGAAAGEAAKAGAEAEAYANSGSGVVKVSGQYVAAGALAGGILGNLVSKAIDKVKNPFIPEIKKDNQPQPPVQQTPPSVEQTPPTVEQTPPTVEQTPPVEEQCDVRPVDEQVTEQQMVETCTIKLKRGQSLYDYVSEGYGIKDHRTVMKIVNHIKSTYGLTPNDRRAISMTEWEIPMEFEGHKFNCDVAPHGTVRRYAKGQRGQVPTHNAEYRDVTRTRYGVENCRQQRLWFNTQAERDAELRAHQGK